MALQYIKLLAQIRCDSQVPRYGCFPITNKLGISFKWKLSVEILSDVSLSCFHGHQIESNHQVSLNIRYFTTYYRLKHKYMRQPRPPGSGVSLSGPYISRVCTPQKLIWIKLDLTV
jgi:hypothetical protein